MKKNVLITIFALCSSFAAQAQMSSTSFTFNGNETYRHISLLDVERVNEYQTQQVPSTCYQNVAYQDQVCGYTTEYKNECYTSAPTQQCNWVPGHQECHMQPGGQQCYTKPGQQVCTNTPPHEECRIVNGRRVCKMVPGHSQCHQQPPQQVCHQTPPQQVCHQTPGKQQCYSVPGQYQCNQVPYQKYSCHNETKYKQEPYTCYTSQQIMVPVEKHRTTADINFDFVQFPGGTNQRIQFDVRLENRDLIIKASDLRKSGLAIMADKSRLDAQKNYDQTSFNGEVPVKVVSLGQLPDSAFIFGGIKDMRLNENNKLILVTNVVQNPESFGLKLEIRNTYSGEILFSGLVDDSNYDQVFETNKTKTKVDIDRLINNYLASGTRLSIKATLSVRDGQFELINADDMMGLSTSSQQEVIWN